MFEFLVRHAESTQIIIFASVITGLWVVERLVLTHPKDRQVRHAAVNSIFILSALPIELVFSVAYLSLSSWLQTHHVGLVFCLPYADNPWIKYGLMFVVLDFLDYVYHRTVHHVPGFWRFHLVHHTDPVVDASTTVREHPGETALRNAFLLLWVALTGASFEVLILRQTAQTICTILAHSAFRLPEGLGRVLGWVFITPNLHHVHHHFELPYTNCNYGDVFSVWDRLFGTFTTLPAAQTVFGLDTHFASPAVETVTGMMTMPFSKDPAPAEAPGVTA